MKCNALTAILLTAWATLLSAAEQPPATAEELAQVNTAIEQIEAWLEDANSERPAFEARLEAVEKQVSESTRAVSEIRGKLATLERQLQQLNENRSELQQARSVQAEQAGRVLRAVYMEGRQSYLKLILNQEDTALAARMLHYYQVSAAMRLSRIETYRETLTALDDNENALQTARAELQENSRTLDTQLAELMEIRNSRQQTLDELKASISERSSELAQLIADRDSLEQLLEEVNRAVESIPVPGDQQPFAELRGRLPWPVTGPLQARYGERYGNGELARQGVTLAASPGTTVRAVHSGRVVFANWLRGTGLLLIIDHGDGYMSLYGHNESLSKARGTWVNAGDEIAIAGQSGGQSATGVYFEIRHDGRPENPEQWCVTAN